MSYEILKHTADLRMEVRGETLQRLFGDAMRGMMSFLNEDIGGQKPSVTRKIVIEAPDVTVLLVDFLNEVLSLAQVNKELYTEVTFDAFSETKVEAEVSGIPVDAFDEDIKAVTYHEANVKKNEAGEWETTLVFDI